MADDRMRFILDFVAQTAGLKNAQELAEQLGTELTDAEDAGKQMAAALKAAADKADRELAETVALADKLGQALGPELTARVNVDEIASKMRQVGMTTADVEANIDDFRSSLTKMADTADQAKARMGDLDDGARRVGDRIDDAGRASHSFAGNVVGDMAGAAAGFGPLSEGIGQVVEGALEGGTAFRNLALAAGGMGVVAFAMTKFTEQRRKAAEVKAFNAKEVEDFTKALRDGDSAVQAIVNHFQEAGKIEVKLNGLVGEMFSGDVVDDMARAGVTIEMLATAAAGGAEGIADLATSMENAGVPIDASAKVMLAAMQTAENMTAAEKVAANWAKISASTLKADLYGATEDVSSGFDRAGRAYDRFMAKFEKEDAVATAVLALGELKDKLAEIQEKLKTGEITYDEALAEATLAFNGTTTSAADAAKALGFFSDAIAEKFEILIEQGDMDAALAKLLQLQRIAALMRSEDWFSNGDGPTATPGGTRVQTVDGERPVTVQSTVVLELNGQAVQQVTATQEAQRRGSR